MSDLPEAIELDPNILLAREDLLTWATEAAEAIDAVPFPRGSETFEAIDRVIICGRREYHLETACMAALWSELHARGLAGLALRYMIQLAVDNEIETHARWRIKTKTPASQ